MEITINIPNHVTEILSGNAKVLHITLEELASECLEELVGCDDLSITVERLKQLLATDGTLRRRTLREQMYRY
jgi:hypothetical protein